MTRVLDLLSGKEREQLRQEAIPEWSPPMLATLTQRRFSSTDWVYERKLDGERCLAFRNGAQVRMMSRNRQHLNDTYPELVTALAAQSLKAFVVDGEIVAFEKGRTSFSRLQTRLGIHDAAVARRSPIKVYLYLFDVLHLAGCRTTTLPLRRRKALLKRALEFTDPLRYTAHRNAHGESYYRAACRKGWEGVIAKRADSAYRGGRSQDWLKLKCVNQQELVIGGYTDPRCARRGFGALLLGYYQDGALRYAGKVGTGFDEQTLEALSARLKAKERHTCPFSPARGRRGGPLGGACPGRPDRFHRVDRRRRQAAPSPVSGSA